MSTDSVGPQPTSDDLPPDATDPGDPEPDQESTESRDVVGEPDAAAVEAARVRMDEVKTEAVINHYRI